uniref:Hydroxy-delta-5-steroid dehydrogenase, 3 beta- and steroid delta-isomerase n=1 Tax=Poecilia formosa TaxID=48698 RepID=A0A087Y6L4_POEFO
TMEENKRTLVYLITGGCGFLGKHLLDVLLEKEEKLAEVRVFDKHIYPGFHEQRKTDEVEVTLIQGDITDYNSVLEATKGVDVVIHSASLVDVWHKIPASLIYSVNVTGTENVIRACVECGVERLVYTSSMEVIGPNVKGDHFKSRGNEDTKYEVKHTMAYPKSKAKAENIVLRANGSQKYVEVVLLLHGCNFLGSACYLKSFVLPSLQEKIWKFQSLKNQTTLELTVQSNVAWMHVLAARALKMNPEKVAGEAFFCYDESPYKSYEDFNMELLSEFNFRKVCMPGIVLCFLAILNDFLRWILSPFYNYTPLLNRYTLAVASTTFTVQTDKAQRYFQYQPLYDWSQCLARTQSWIRTFPADKQKDS